MKYLFSLIAIIMAMSAWVRPAQASFIVHKSNALGLSNGLVGWWTFDGKDMGTSAPWGVIDRSGQGNNGKYWNSTSTSPAVIGRLGQGLSFDGSNDYVSAGYISTYDFPDTTFTVSGWFRNVQPAAATQQYIISNRDESIGSIYYRYVFQCR